MSAAGSGAGGACAPRRYDERQLRCLGAMGLTAWVGRASTSAVPPVGTRGTVSGAPVTGSVPDAVVVPEPAPVAPPEAVAAPVPARAGPSAASAASPPVSPAAPDPVPTPPTPSASGTLSARRVEAFERRGTSVFETNPDGGRTLVAIERGDAAGEPSGAARTPIAGEAAELLRLMLRAIDLTPADVSLCALGAADAASVGPDAAPGAAAAAPAVRELLGGPRRTVLWLVHDVDGAGPVDVEADAALRALGVAAFRVPHPALLLERPAAKREAWAALKAVRRRMRDAAPAADPAAGRGAASGAPAGAAR